jgi:hypothetical protein
VIKRLATTTGLAATLAAGSVVGALAAATDAAPFDQEKALAELQARIAGRENEPAEKVFRDIQLFKGVPAARVLGIMDKGFSPALGVDCTHCHVVGAWEKSDKPQKQIAREMMKMTGTINDELLPKIAHLKSEKPIINCTTCHRGERKPALELAQTSRAR